MTVQVIDPRVTAGAPVRQTRPSVAPHRDAARRNLGPAQGADWGAASARACVVSASASSVEYGFYAAPQRLYWTPRGLAVLVGLVSLVLGIMTVTLLTAFFSVSNEPLTAAELRSVAAAPAVPGPPVR